MTYTFDPNLNDVVSLVRFHIGDNHSEGHFLEDETIRYLVQSQGTEKAVIACLKYIITQLSTPNFVLDWMEVNNQEARKGYESVLKDKRKEFGLGAHSATATISLPSRADSYQVDNDYSEVSEEEL